MKRIVALTAMALLLMFGLQAMAQEPPFSPLIMEGDKELGLSGNLDFEGEGPDGDFNLNISGTYGYFIRNYLEVGGFANLNMIDGTDFMRYGLGGFAEYHFARWEPFGWQSVIPYVGASLGLAFADPDEGEDQSALIFMPRVGIKWFIRNYFAIDTNFFVALATDDIYKNGEDLDPYDIGLSLGLRVFFN